MFSLVWWVCQKCQPNQQQHVYKPGCIKETACTIMGLDLCLNSARERSYFEHAKVCFARAQTEFCGENVCFAKKKVKLKENQFCI